MQVFQIPPERIWVSVFEKDEEAFALWRDQVGVPEQRIKRMGAADNFWAAGPTGGLTHLCDASDHLLSVQHACGLRQGPV